MSVHLHCKATGLSRRHSKRGEFTQSQTCISFDKEVELPHDSRVVESEQIASFGSAALPRFPEGVHEVWKDKHTPIENTSCILWADDLWRYVRLGHWNTQTPVSVLRERMGSYI